MEQTRIEDALIALRRVMRAIEISSLSLAKKSGLTPTQLIVLQVIAAVDNATPSYVSVKTTLSQATITTVLDKLEKKSLVARQRDNTDKRRLYLRVTELGRQTIATAPDILQIQFQRSFQRLNDWEQSMIVASFQRVASMLDAEQIDAAPILDYGELNTPPEAR